MQPGQLPQARSRRQGERGAEAVQSDGEHQRVPRGVQGVRRACAGQNFLTVDLFEGKNMGAVVRNLHSLGRVAQAHGFQGPTLGTRLSTPNRRSFFTEQQAIAGRASNPGLGLVGATNPGLDLGGVAGRRDVAGPRDVRPVSAQSSSTLLSHPTPSPAGRGVDLVDYSV